MGDELNVVLIVAAFILMIFVVAIMIALILKPQPIPMEVQSDIWNLLKVWAIQLLPV